MLLDQASRERYIELCEDRVRYHNKNANNARHWNNVLNIGNIVLGTLMAFSLTLCALLQTESLTTTLVGASFNVFIIIGNSLKDTFSFKSLSYMHENSCDNFSELKNEFENNYTLELIPKYQTQIQRSHHQPVKTCYFCCCYNAS